MSAAQVADVFQILCVGKGQPKHEHVEVVGVQHREAIAQQWNRSHGVVGAIRPPEYHPGMFYGSRIVIDD